MRSRKKMNLEDLSVLEIFGLKKEGVIERFPFDFWSKNVARQILRFELLKEMKLNRDQLCKFNFRGELKKKGIIGALDIFQYSTLQLVNYCFSEYEIKAWELNCTPNCFFNNKENVKEAINWMFEKESIKTKQQICKRFSADILRENGLKTLCKKYTLYELIQMTVPEMNIKEWELKKMFFWDNELIQKAVKWLIEEKLCWEYDDVCKKISATVFRKNGLDGMLSKGCDNSTIKALEIAYPGVYSKDVLWGYSQS